ncbi:GAF domain-containing protein [Halorussus salilacus]|uniref:bacterio-opsin activator domain-containing protein n=1 Tax=Halorussus salilacus TaxID=2953750 RepID=UPI00209FFAED|nr:bacterio-opsin activator domain-containing protein [Halorussus salilacus]USZ67854.1 GAF domain-containing protein [Halorussus salilacus]
MDTTRSPRTAADVSVLLVGPTAWRERVGPAFEASAAFSVRAVGTPERAMAAATELDAATDCVVSAQDLDPGTGLELLADLGSRGVSAPFLLVPADGSESLASDALGAGVDDYLSASADPGELRRRCRRAVRRASERRRRREKADGFEAVVSTPDEFAAVLDADGTVERVNDAALGYLDAEADAVLGKRFWGLPWSDADDSRRAVQRALRRAREGEYADFEAALSGDAGDTRFEFSARPVAGDSGSPGDPESSSPSRSPVSPNDDEAVDRLVVEGREVAERVRLEQELRDSEELHRVTLNNMTDTVLVTDDDGEFTYVCPNVHFIFGYTAEEIHEMGTIDALLGEDLFDRERLESEGVLTNLECAATDEEGREHTLLVNVRRVSIQGGTTLYSCRDITTRKQREQALTQLHRTSRGLLYAETKDDIADRVVSDATAILPSAAAAVYRFDREANVLTPTAASEEFADLASTGGSLPDLRLGRDTVVARAFIDEETRTPGGRPEEENGTLLALPGDYVAVPLGDHGVFVAAATDGDAFDAIGEEVAELVAATTEAALDRVERETELRERDRTLQRQNRRLSQLNRINEFIREIDQALVGAESREEIETAVCERLVADDRFAFAWIGDTTPLRRTLQPRAWAGDERGYLDGVPLGFDADGGDAADAASPPSREPSVRAADDREPVLVSNVADHLRTGRWCKEAVARDLQSVLAIPLVYDDVLLGTLTVYADSPDAFDEMVESVLGELGDTVASAINAVQRKEALDSDTVVELEYRISDPSALCSRLADETGGAVEVEGDVAREDGTTLVFAAVEGVALDRAVETAEGFVGVEDAEPIRATDEGGIVGLQTSEDFVTAAIADHGAVVRRLRATPEGITLAVDVPDSVTTRSIDEVVSNTYDAAEPVAQRERTRALDTRGRPGRFLDDLTERQLEVARMAYHTGFFDSQRDVTGRDVAAMLDISHTAFYDHVRRIQRKLFASLFEGRARPTHVE